MYKVIAPFKYRADQSIFKVGTHQ